MRIAALLALAGLAAGAHAQSGSAMWMAEVETLNELMVKATLLLSMEADTPFVALSATIFDTLNTAGADEGDIIGWEVLNSLDELTGDLTTSDGDNLYGTNAGQLTVFGPFTSANPIDVLSFTWQSNSLFIDAVGVPIDYTTATENVTLWVGDDKDGAVALDVTNDVTEAAFGWFVSPTPATAAVLCLGGLVLSRRRR